MIVLALLGFGLLADAPTANPADIRAQYETKRAQAGRDPAAHVKLALWCESQGMPTERLRHLAIAVMTDPSNRAARGLLGLVFDNGAWRKPEEIAERAKADQELAANLAAYNERRARTGRTADDQWQLGLWCERNGLPAEAKAHFTAVVRLDPKQESAWKRLGCKKVNGRWLNEEQIAADKAEAEAQAKADRKWRPLLEHWKSNLAHKEKAAEAETRLNEVVDPRAVPSIVRVFGTGKAIDQAWAVRMLGQIDSAASSRSLALFGIFGATAEVRRPAIETLKHRDPREFAYVLVSMLRDPIKYRVQPVGGPGSPGVLMIEGDQANVARTYSPPGMPPLPLPLGGQILYDSDGLPMFTVEMSSLSQSSSSFHTELSLKQNQLAQYHPTDPEAAAAFADFEANSSTIMANFYQSHPITAGFKARNPAAFNKVFSYQLGEEVEKTTIRSTEEVIPIGRMMMERQIAAAVAQQQLASDTAVVEALNAQIRSSSNRVAQALRDITGDDRGDAVEGWRAWWTGLQGYAYQKPPEREKSTIVQDVPLAYLPQSRPSLALSTSSTSKTFGPLQFKPCSTVSCFAAGTLVRTRDGLRTIETLQVGDLVLAQEPTSGALDYQPILTVYHNPPSTTLRVDFGGEAVVASIFHRFWLVGSGWKMARELKPGDRLRTLKGIVEVRSVSEDKVQPVFNLDVAEARTFFVGEGGALVHDNSVPGLRTTPFDATAD